MAKRKRYVAPIGGRLPECPIRPDGKAVWEYLAECCEVWATWVPPGEEPQTLGWKDPWESVHKERAEKLAAEREHSPEACFVMRERLDWARGMARTLSRLPSCAGCAPLNPPPVPAGELLLWLAFDLYDAGPRWPRMWWDGSSFEQWHGL